MLTDISDDAEKTLQLVDMKKKTDTKILLDFNAEREYFLQDYERSYMLILKNMEVRKKA